LTLERSREYRRLTEGVKLSGSRTEGRQVYHWGLGKNFLDVIAPEFGNCIRMGLQTPLYQEHVALGAKIVPFGGWDMPLHYGSQLEEHHSVRSDAGMFDVSHMTIVDIEGAAAKNFLRRLLANDVQRLTASGAALYSCMLNESGGIIDDLIVYYIDDTHYRMVVNAATRDKDLAWIRQQAQPFSVAINERANLAMIAVQGPNARDKFHAVASPSVRQAAQSLKRFHAVPVDDCFIARTGYTGEDGYEIMVPASAAAGLWKRLLQNDVHPCGLGARDTLRLEAGMNLYGTDMDEQANPLESGLAWTVVWDPEHRDFIGRPALEKLKHESLPQQVGLVLLDKGVLRNHQAVSCDGEQAGEITSGGFSPTLNCSIALARIKRGAEKKNCWVDIRNRKAAIRIVKPPFARNGRSCVE